MSDYFTAPTTNAPTGLPLFDAPPPSQPTPTSQAAAESIQQVRSALGARVLAYLEQCGDHGATDREIATALSIDGNSGRPRRIELVRLGLAADSGRTRPTPRGRRSTVWVATITPTRGSHAQQ